MGAAIKYKKNAVDAACIISKGSPRAYVAAIRSKVGFCVIYITEARFKIPP